MIFATCLIKDKKEETINKMTKLIKHLARHFTLLYICKNGKLDNKVSNELSPEETRLLNSNGIEVSSESFSRKSLCEMNPLIFLDIVCEFLHEGNKDVVIGSEIVLNEIFVLMKSFYPVEEDYSNALRNLEFIDLLFKKICHLAYYDGSRKKIGCITALNILIEHSPKSVLVKYNYTIIESMIVIIKGMLISYGGLPNKIISTCLLKLARKSNFFIGQVNELRSIINLIFMNFQEVS